MLGLVSLAAVAAASERPAADASTVTILAEATLLDSAGAFTPCPSPCAVAVGDAPVTVWSSGSRGLALDSGDAGKVFRVTRGHPVRRGVGWILAVASASTSSITFAAAGLDVGAVPYFTLAAATFTGLGLTIGTRPRFVEEGQ